MLDNTTPTPNEAELVFFEDQAVPAPHGIVGLLRLMAAKHVTMINKETTM